MPLTTTQQHFTKFYLAAFLRAPDLGGLNYWTNEVLKPGQSLQTVGGTIFSLDIVKAIYPANLTDTQFVEAIYKNVFGRTSDAGGMTYWTGEIANLRSGLIAQGHDSSFAAFEARGQLTMNMINAGLGTVEGTEGKAYIENRLDVAEYAAEQQLAQGEEIPVFFLLDLFRNVNADAASVVGGISAVDNVFTDTTAPILQAFGVTTSSLHSGTLTTDFAGGDDIGRSVIQQADGKLLLAGSAKEGDHLGSLNFALARYNLDGSLDTSFDGDGKLMTDFAGSYDSGSSLVQQADGKLVVAGESDGVEGDFALARYNLDGSLDSSFGSNGKVKTDFAGSTDFGKSLVQQADGKLVVAGSAFDGISYNFALARYNLDGTLDTSFDNDGKVTADFGGGVDHGYNLIQQADGKFLIVGSSNYSFAMARYSADGSLEVRFTHSGFSGNDVIQQADGKLLVTGYAYENGNVNFALARFNLDGSKDMSFDSDGKVTTDFAGNREYATSVIQQADGKLVVAGYVLVSGDLNDIADTSFALARYNADGTLDTSFGGGDGLVTTSLGGRMSLDNGYSLIQQADGKLLLAGVSGSGVADFALARYNPDGSLDTSFGTERLSALSLTSNEFATAGLYDGSNTLIGSTVNLSANTATDLEVSAQASVTQTNLRLTDVAGNNTTDSTVTLGTTGNDIVTLIAPGYLFGFDGNDTLTGSSGADVFIGGSGNDFLSLGFDFVSQSLDSQVDRVMFEANGMGYDTINGLVQGTGGDVLDVAALTLGSLSFHASVFSANPGAATDISGQVVRLLDISGGLDITDTYATGDLNLALNSGEYANLDMQANRSALVLTADSSNATINYLFRVDSTDTGSVGAVELIGIINNADIDLWTAGNFAF